MDSAVNLLVIEDNPADADLIKEYLSEVTEFKANLHWAPTLKDGQKFLEENHVHAVLVDLTLPDSQGLETVRAVVSRLKSATAIVLTSLDDKDTALDAIESGAQDYLLKNTMGPEALSRVIRYSLQRSKWQTKITEIQDQLYQSQKMESIGRLAGGVAHDFNNQLAVVTFLCSALQKELPEAHASQKHITQILTACEKSADMIKRLLTFSRSHSLELKVVDINDIVRETEALLTKLLSKQIGIRTKFGAPALVEVDSSLLEHALMNLAINARDAMPSGGQLVFETEVQENHVILKVSDTGSGIPPDILGKIFEPFFTTKGVGRGTGLGLSMVYGTVKQMHGSIHVESVLGGGTTFVMQFPLAGGERPLASATPSEDARVTPASGRILIVEDEEVLREAVGLMLEMNGYTILTAKDGNEAMHLLAQSQAPIDLVLTDINMPNMDGLELQERLQAINPEVRIIVTSGYSAQGEEMVKRLASRRVGYLPKPSSMKQLLGKIREMMSDD